MLVQRISTAIFFLIILLINPINSKAVLSVHEEPKNSGKQRIKFIESIK